MKLYAVRLITYGVVLADSEWDAKEYADQIYEPCIVEAERIDPVSLVLPPGWNVEDSVYHGGSEDLTVAQALEKIK